MTGLKAHSTYLSSVSTYIPYENSFNARLKKSISHKCLLCGEFIFIHKENKDKYKMCRTVHLTCMHRYKNNKRSKEFQ